jgi:prolyl-tRNA editing enzyme YbaK/EbsC (Cys-tRNA(Pro) deacylase)
VEGDPVKGTLDIHRELLARDVAHEVIRLPRPVLDARELPEALGLPAERCAAVRVYQADETLAAVVLPCGQAADPARLLNLLGARSLRTAGPDLINSVTDFAAGLVSPLLLPPEVVVLIDAALTRVNVVYVPTGESGTALGIPSRDLVTLSRATVGELCLPDSARLELGALEEALARAGSNNGNGVGNGAGDDWPEAAHSPNATSRQH